MKYKKVKDLMYIKKTELGRMDYLKKRVIHYLLNNFPSDLELYKIKIGLLKFNEESKIKIDTNGNFLFSAKEILKKGSKIKYPKEQYIENLFKKDYAVDFVFTNKKALLEKFDDVEFSNIDVFPDEMGSCYKDGKKYEFYLKRNFVTRFGKFNTLIIVKDQIKKKKSKLVL